MKSKFDLNSYQEYLLFLFIYLANSDYSIHLLEIDTIYTKMKTLFPYESNLEQVYQDVKEKYDSLGLEEVEILIEENFQIFKSQISNKENLFNDLYDIITSDGIIMDYEILAFDKIKKIISHS